MEHCSVIGVMWNITRRIRWWCAWWVAWATTGWFRWRTTWWILGLSLGGSDGELLGKVLVGLSLCDNDGEPFGETLGVWPGETFRHSSLQQEPVCWLCGAIIFTQPENLNIWFILAFGSKSQWNTLVKRFSNVKYYQKTSHFWCFPWANGLVELCSKRKHTVHGANGLFELSSIVVIKHIIHGADFWCVSMVWLNSVAW